VPSGGPCRLASAWDRLLATGLAPLVRWTIVLLLILGPIPGIPGFAQLQQAFWPGSAASGSPLSFAEPQFLTTDPTASLDARPASLASARFSAARKTGVGPIPLPDRSADEPAGVWLQLIGLLLLTASLWLATVGLRATRRLRAPPACRTLLAQP
jgi:hypothetical protein